MSESATATIVPAATTEAPVAAPAAVTPPATAPVTPPAVAENLLADAPKVEEPKTETPKVEEPVVRKPEEILAAIKLPDGIVKDDALVTAFLDGASKSNLSDTAAQALVDQMAPEILKQISAPYEAWKTLQETWQAQVKADPEIGGEKLPGVVQTINKAMALFGEEADTAVKEALQMTGAGNNPAIIKMFYKMAARLTEGGGPVTGAPPTPGKSAAELLYGNNKTA